MVLYYRTTRDGRIVFGRGGEAHAYLGRVTRDFEDPGRRIAHTERLFRRTYPALADVRLTHRWTGAVDRSEKNAPFFGRLEGNPRVLYGVGFSGTGVAQTLVGARILASSALDRDDEWSRTPLNRGPASLFPPDPARFFGGILVRAALERQEAAEDTGQQAGPLVRAIANLAPAGVRKGG
jgi:glycine/D-amino acid oxidase-like deaminating enzyme